MFKPILYTLVITLTSLVFYGQVNAVDPSDFEAGRIIDDAVFTDKTAMNVNEIQAFLDAKMPNCDVNGTGTSPWYAPDYDGDGKQERWEYGQYKGNPTPFTCLKDYVENPTTQVNNYGGGSVSGGKTAAEIIWQAAQDHDINPQVLLVTLQKESSLVTDAWPFERQFDRAMGYACPDSGPNNSANCDESHYGFANQINKAAWQFRRYLTYPDNYNFAVGNRYIQYNPSASCGGSTVNIQTAVTAALYNYTPYQPNQAALNNYPGTASCGAYGNRNFWFTFNEWFGGTRLDDYSLTEVNITPTVDIVEGGERAFAVRLKNTGAFTLHEAGTNGSDEVRIVTSPLGRNSTVSGSYESKTKATSVLHSVYESDGVTLSEDQNTIETNEIGRFVVRISIPEDFEPGAFTEILAARLDNRMNISDPFEFNINILEKKYSASFGGSSLNLSGKPGETVAAAVRYKNTGNTTWYDFTSRPDSSTRPFVLATAKPTNRISPFNDSFDGRARPSLTIDQVFEADGITLSPTQNVVKPGQIARFRFILNIPENIKPGIYDEWVKPLFEGAKFEFSTPSNRIRINVQESTYAYIEVAHTPSVELTSGETVAAAVRYKNTGNTTWYDFTSRPDSSTRPFVLATAKPTNRISPFNDSFDGRARPSLTIDQVFEADGITLSPTQNVVKPGQIARFRFLITAPSDINQGTYFEYFRPLFEGANFAYPYTDFNLRINIE